jgi:hypothetical protein
MSEQIQPADVNWQTGAEIISERGTALDVSDQIIIDAYELAVEHGLNGALSGRQPSMVAAACVYFVGLLHNEKVTQATVADVFGVSSQYITPAYHALSEAEGFDVEPDRGERDVVSEETPSQPASDSDDAASSHWLLHPVFQVGVPLAAVVGFTSVMYEAVVSEIPTTAFARATEEIVRPPHTGSLTLLVMTAIFVVSTVVVSVLEQRVMESGGH